MFLVRPTYKGLLPNLLAAVLRLVTGILDAEPDQTLQIPTSPTNQALATTPPAGLWDTTPVNYYGTSAADLRVALASLIVLIAVAVLAAAIPARRAASLDPMQALRAE